MRITADTTVLVRVIVADDPIQTALAQEQLAHADLVALPVVALCEMAWTLSRAYKLKAAHIALALRTLVSSYNVVTDRSAVDAGLAVLDAGGDFADGILAYQGQMLGGQSFVSFDKDAVSLIAAQGIDAELMG